MGIKKIVLGFFLFSSITTSIALSQVSDEFRHKLTSLKWVAFAPTNFNPEKEIYPSEDSLRKDLQVLFQHGFNGVVTYGANATLAKIPQLAKEIGFSGVIMGIWDIESKDEMENAFLAKNYVDGYCLGNEGLNSRYDAEGLKRAIAQMKDLTGLPVTTTEQIFDYYNDSVLTIGDWIFPNIHPFLCSIRGAKKCVNWIEKNYEILKKHNKDGRPILFKEVGFPTSGDNSASEANQRDFFLESEKAGIPFVYFEAFDQPWKNNLPVEPHWGLFKQNRRPKKFMLTK
ncbi:MAG: hypothetical protein PHY94_07285 [Candidatus Omnitrophica bacterium]|nr:hypothetical protein [Candidatus Omnitrophota bacterium]